MNYPEEQVIIAARALVQAFDRLAITIAQLDEATEAGDDAELYTVDE